MSIEFGKHTYGKGNVKVIGSYGDNKVVFGKFCSLGDHIEILLNLDHRTDWVTTYPFGNLKPSPFKVFSGEGHPKSNGDVIVGNDVWIGRKVTIMSGVTIGDGAVVASNSHVIKDVEPYSIVGGNPAKFIKYRFDQQTIKQLLDIAWWNWDDERIDENSPLLCQPDIEMFIKEHK